MSQQALLYVALLEAFGAHDQLTVYKTFADVRKMPQNDRLEILQLLSEISNASEYAILNWFNFVITELRSVNASTEYKGRLLESSKSYYTTYLENSIKPTSSYLDVLIASLEAGLHISDETATLLVLRIQEYLELTADIRLQYRTFKLIRLTRNPILLEDMLNFTLDITETHALILGYFFLLVDVDCDTHALTLIDNKHSDLGWLNLVIVNVVAAMVHCGRAPLTRIIKRLSSSPLLKPSYRECVDSIILKIFTDDEALLFDGLCILVERFEEFECFDVMDPVQFFEAMLLGSESGESFYSEYLERNPDSLRFSLLVIKHMCSRDRFVVFAQSKQILEELMQHPKTHRALKRQLSLLLYGEDRL